MLNIKISSLFWLDLEKSEIINSYSIYVEDTVMARMMLSSQFKWLEGPRRFEQCANHGKRGISVSMGIVEIQK